MKSKFNVNGMTCPSCEKILVKRVGKLGGVEDFTVDYVSGEAAVEYDPDETDLDEIFDVVEDAGYEPRMRSQGFSRRLTFRIEDVKNVSLLLGALTILAGGYFILHDSLGFTMPALDQNASLALVFTIGLFTGFHCVAMCGGFVVSYSAKKASEGKVDYGSHLTYGVSKTFSYAFFGAVFGFLGSFFTFTPMMRGLAAVLAGLFLVLFGLNMLDMLKWFRRFRLKTPGVVSKLFSKDLGPASIGLLNGLMIACGPLQAIYILAAATGSAYYGALYLAAFGLGTLPVLLGFGVLTSMVSSRLTHKIVRYSGVLVVVLGLIMVNRGLALTGTGYDLNTLSVSAQPAEVDGEAEPITLGEDGFQEIRMEVNRYGWEPDRFVLKKGVPVKWIIDGKEINGCNNAIQVPKLGLEFDITPGVQTIEFTPEEEGVIPWSCWMGMIPGAFVVSDDVDVNNPVEVQEQLETVEVPQGGSCDGSCGTPTCGAAAGGTCGCGGRR